MLAWTLNRRITIQRPETTRDSFGQRSTAWINHDFAWANIRAGSGREFIAADKETSEVSVSVRIRYREDINATMRVLVNGSPMNIQAVVPDMEGRKYLDLVCTRGANNG